MEPLKVVVNQKNTKKNRDKLRAASVMK